MKTIAIPILLVVLLALCGCCIVVLSAGGIILANLPAATQPVPSDAPFEPTPTIEILRPEVEGSAHETQSAVQGMDVPLSDLAGLACRLEGKCNIPATMAPPAAPRAVGEKQAFWALNIDSNYYIQAQATLQLVSEHAYFWIEDGITYHPADLEALAQEFEQVVHPTTRSFFGSEWSPGVDGDPRLYILYARNLGLGLLGAFSSADEYHPLAVQYSNAHEMFLLGADSIHLNDPSIAGVLAHEYQHMIHWHLDRNETTWLNEGFSELSAFLSGYDPGGADAYFLANPDLQLTDWEAEAGNNYAHYGASFLFAAYFLDRFGDEMTQALAAHPLNGMDSVDAALSAHNARDALTGAPVTADDLFLDWAVTNYLDDGRAADGRYTYHNYPDSPTVQQAATLEGCQVSVNATVHQYGADYLRLDCPRDFTLRFEGATLANLLPVEAHSGEYAFWSNKGDESNMTLTRLFDFRSLAGPIHLSYWTWYDLEADYDYLHLEASTDGLRWQILATPSGTGEDPTGNSYGWGYNGRSGGWIEETVDLSQYAGQQVYIRFDYITDAAVNGEGFLLDDVSVTAAGYRSDFETDDGGWQAAGFVRVTNILPQQFRLALVIRSREGATVQVIPLTAAQTALVPVTVDDQVEEVALVVTAVTRLTRIPAAYSVTIETP